MSNVGQFHETENGKRIVFWLTVAVLGISLAHSIRAITRVS